MARQIEPPPGWTNDYEQLGGDDEWANEGPMHQLLCDLGVDVTGLKPLYALEAGTGGNLVLFETGSPPAFYFFSPIEFSLYKINLFTDLGELVEWIGDEEKGYRSLDVDQLN